MSNQHSTEIKSGILFGLSATLLWGSYPLWYKPLGNIDSWQLLSWRVLFAEIFLVLLLFITSRHKSFFKLLHNVSFKNVAIVSFILGAWWFIYIYGIVTNRVLEVALGYFISPIMSMAVSRIVFKEKISALQYAAMAFAALGVVLMALHSLSWTSIPWIPLSVGFCFSFYAIFKKKVSGDLLVVQSLEILLLLPIAVGILGWVFLQGEGHLFLTNYTVDLLLMATGVITVLPLWWYNIAAKQLPLIMLSFLQFVTPTCNFLLGIFVYHETLDPYKLVVFMFIWVGVAIFMLDAIVKARIKNRLAASK